MDKTYGGYLPIELTKNSAFYQGKGVVALNSGRYAIAYALRETGWNSIYLPYYLCSTVEETITQLLPEIQIRYYHIDQAFLPDSVRLHEQEGLLWVNYFGVQPESAVDKVVRRYRGRLLIDNTQAFFSAPRAEACQVYSCRKFFGVPDGSYVIQEGIPLRPLPASYSSPYAAHLLYSLEHGTDYSYTQSKENEERLGHCGMEAMAPLTSSILNGIDYAEVARLRTANFRILHQILGKYNRISFDGSWPALYYPFLCDTDGLLQQLVRHKIYVPCLWKETLDNPDSSSWEKFLSGHLCVLPIDQRYREDDMREIGKLTLRLIDENNKKADEHET